MMAARNGGQIYLCTGLHVRARVAAREAFEKAVRTGIAFIQTISTSPKSVLSTERNTP
jgi:hypothetical protein